MHLCTIFLLLTKQLSTVFTSNLFIFAFFGLLEARDSNCWLYLFISASHWKNQLPSPIITHITRSSKDGLVSACFRQSCIVFVRSCFCFAVRWFKLSSSAYIRAGSRRFWRIRTRTYCVLLLIQLSIDLLFRGISVTLSWKFLNSLCYQKIWTRLKALSPNTFINLL